MLDNHAMGHRYKLLHLLGSGGMGEVYCAYDHLTRSRVALKRLLLGPNQPKASGGKTKLHLNLVREFSIAASLRHRHIIGVLDYGFDEHDLPFYTMELLDNAKHLTDAAKDLPLHRKLALLMQAMSAIAYLHHRNVVHGDLKPGNILVADGHLKILDFGLSHAQKYRQDVANRESGGTVAYMAPEVLEDKTGQTKTSDMYSFGLIAYEILLGYHPFARSGDFALLLHNRDVAVPDYAELPSELRNLIPDMLIPNFEQRSITAQDALQQFEAVTGISYGHQHIRSSFLQAAEFVGRTNELNDLKIALSNAKDRKGSLWLVGGASGVGKSRLIEELRIQALAEGAWVVRGQAAEGRAAYHVWGDVVRFLALSQPHLSDRALGVLKAIAPNLGQIMRREDIPDPPTIEPRAAQQRLLTHLEHLFEGCNHLLVLLLEDLQWSPESRAILEHLAEKCREWPILIIGTGYTTPISRLKSGIQAAYAMTLERFSETEINALSVSMAGENILNKPSLISDISKQSGGNPYFMVSILKHLVDQADGKLKVIHQTEIREGFFAKDLETIIGDYYLDKLPQEDQTLLEFAAIAGRQIDLDLLQTQQPTIDVQGWLERCQDAEIIEINAGNWQFAHDQLRNCVIDGLDQTKQKQVHFEVAQRLEVLYPQDAMRLAYHWEKAAQNDKAAHFLATGGIQALVNGAYESAATTLSRALTLAVDRSPAEQATIGFHLGRAQYGMGNMLASEKSLLNALKCLGIRYPSNNVTLTIRNIYKSMRAFFPHPSALRSDNAQLAAEIFAQLLLVHFFQNKNWETMHDLLNGFNYSEYLPQSDDAIRLNVIFRSNLMVTLGMLKQHGMARRIQKETNRYKDNISEETRAYSLIVQATYAQAQGHWQESEDYLLEGMKLAESVGNLRMWGEMAALCSNTYFYRGMWEDSDSLMVQVLERGIANRDLQMQAWSHLTRSAIAINRDHIARARELANEACALQNQIEPFNSQHTLSWASLINVYVAEHDWFRAIPLAKKATEYIWKTKPLAPTLLFSYVAVAECYLYNWIDKPTNTNHKLFRQSLQQLRNFANVFPIGKPVLHLLQAQYELKQGKDAQRTIQKAVDSAKQFDMLYYEGRVYVVQALYNGENKRAWALAEETFKEFVGRWPHHK